MMRQQNHTSGTPGREAARGGPADDPRRSAAGAGEQGRRLSGPLTTPYRRPPARPVAPLLSIGVDIGGTKVAAGVVDERGVVLERRQEPTPSHSPKAVEDAILQLVAQLGARHRV